MTDDLDPLDELRADVNEATARFQRAQRRARIVRWFALPAMGAWICAIMFDAPVPLGWNILITLTAAAIWIGHEIASRGSQSRMAEALKEMAALERRLEIMETTPITPPTPEQLAVMRDVQKAWNTAASDLGIEVYAPARYFSGELTVAIRGFGSSRGIALVLPGDPGSVIAVAHDIGIRIEPIDPDEFRTYRREHFIDRLCHWRWTGEGVAPGWYRPNPPTRDAPLDLL